MFKIVKKPELPTLSALMLRLLAVLVALLCAMLILALIGYNPWEIYAKIVEGALGSSYRWQGTINKAIPLIILSLGIAVAFRMKFWNIGAEGQFYMGAFAASCVAFSLPDLPMIMMLPLMFLAGMLGGAAWALIPGWLKSRYGTSETLVTLMMNYVALYWIAYLKYGPWKDPLAGGFPQFPRFVEAAILPKILGIHLGWIIALVLVILIYILLNKSKFGFESAVLGESESTARYAGINVTKIVILSAMISGGLCGVAGMIQASGVEQSISDQLSGGLGYTAIITTWLARLSPPAIVMVSFFFAILLQGGSFLQSSMQIPASLAAVIQGIILFFVLASEFFIEYKVILRPRRSVNPVVQPDEEGAR